MHFCGLTLTILLFIDPPIFQAELNPVSCTGGKFDLIKIPLVTLIDTLDTLVILGNHSEFRRAVGVVSDRMPNFNLDVNVSVFETTIRILGGLLSAHLMAIDPKLAIYVRTGLLFPPVRGLTRDGALFQEPGQDHPVIAPYDGRLLNLAVDLGERLMPAFETKTSIPYGTVNLLYGVPQGETKIASTAGAGSLLLEFQVLSYLSGQAKFGAAAYAATKGLFQRKSAIGLLGKHINTETGQWSESLSGVGSNADSFYEYLLKSYLLFRDKEVRRVLFMLPLNVHP
jgi:mannosidase alpha-like ER degradation enhancer 2